VTREDWMRRLGPLYGGAVALVSSTPWRWPDAVTSETRSSLWVVLIGIPIGFVAWLAGGALRSIGMPVAVGAIVALAILSLASAALMERGVAERIDGRDRSPSVPTILTLVFMTLIRAVAVMSIAPMHWLAVFIAVALAGRWAAVFLQALGDPIVDDDARRSLVATPSPAWLTAAISIGVATIAVVALGKRGFVALAITAVATFFLGVDAQRRDAGLSAPIVAVAAAIGEGVMLLAAATLT
jgi:cobalamin synthase